LIEDAAGHGCRILSISDSLVSPVAKPATVVLQVREAEIRKFRSLSTSMCLAQALVISFAFESSSTKRNDSALRSSRPGRQE
jgi:DNA-binding MurR/RpiR family transcriptional regulator